MAYLPADKVVVGSQPHVHGRGMLAHLVKAHRVRVDDFQKRGALAGRVRHLALGDGLPAGAARANVIHEPPHRHAVLKEEKAG